MILSFIIPIYNVQDYIEGCVSSIYEGNVDESLFEVIAINDGTKDNSMAIVEEYAQKHSNLHIINKENEGVSKARNLGFDLAKGDYVSFVDADDKIYSDSLPKIFRSLEDKPDTEVLVTRKMGSDGREITNWPGKCSTNRFYTGIEILRLNAGQSSVSTLIFSKQFIQKYKLRFLPIRNSEDYIFYTEAMVYAKNVLFLDYYYYYHVNFREGSATKCFDKSKVNDYVNGIVYVENILLTRELTNESIAIFDNLKLHCITSGMYVGVLCGVSYRQLKQSIGKYCHFYKTDSFKKTIVSKYFWLFYLLDLIKYKVIKKEDNMLRIIKSGG